MINDIKMIKKIKLIKIKINKINRSLKKNIIKRSKPI